MPGLRSLASLANQPVTRLETVKPALAKGLATLGIGNVLDLLSHYPRRYIDRTRISLSLIHI